MGGRAWKGQGPVRGPERQPGLGSGQSEARVAHAVARSALLPAAGATWVSGCAPCLTGSFQEGDREEFQVPGWEGTTPPLRVLRTQSELSLAFHFSDQITYDIPHLERTRVSR